MLPRAASPAPRALRAVLPLGALAACSGAQSALDPAGTDAATVARLFWVMLAGAVVLWLLVNGLALVLTRLSPGAHSRPGSATRSSSAGASSSPWWCSRGC